MPTESQTIEFKDSWRDEYLKWICGFADVQGGMFYISVCGVQNAKKLNIRKSLIKQEVIWRLTL